MKVKNSKQLYNKLLFIYTSVLVGIVLILMMYFIMNTRQRILHTNQEYMKMMGEEAAAYMEESSNVAGIIHKDLYKSDMEMDDLLHYFRDTPEDYWKYRLNTYSDSALQGYKGIEDFINESFDAYSTLKRITLVGYKNGDMKYFTGNRNAYPKAKGTEALSRIEYGNLADPGEFSFLKEVRDPLTMESVGAMIVTFRADGLEELQEYYSLGELTVYNDAGTIIFDSGDTGPFWKLESARVEENLESYLGAYVETAEVEDYHMISWLPKEKAAVIPLTLSLMIVFVGAAVIVVGELLVQAYLKRLAGRLNRILDGMNRVMEGDLTARLSADRNGDELDVISRHFNEMCEKLDLHIRKSYLAEIEQKNAEMAALQSQINPHFLYNTLEAIRMKAICNGDREVGKMLYSMAVIFRSQIKEADIITLAQELHYCKKYLELFEYRYQNQFRSEVECPEEFINVPVIKFVLQPIIENYFIHGMRMGEEDNFIAVHVEKEDGDYRIIVEDNGRGMSAVEVEAKNRQLCADEMDNTKSIGISNVNRRVKAVYGDAYGLHIETREEGGLRVVLRFRPEEECES